MKMKRESRFYICRDCYHETKVVVPEDALIVVVCFDCEERMTEMDVRP